MKHFFYQDEQNFNWSLQNKSITVIFDIIWNTFFRYSIKKNYLCLEICIYQRYIGIYHLASNTLSVTWFNFHYFLWNTFFPKNGYPSSWSWFSAIRSYHVLVFLYLQFPLIFILRWHGSLAVRRGPLGIDTGH